MTSKILAVTLNLALVGSSFADVPGVASSAPKGPDFLATFTPPQSLGYVTDSFKGNTDKPVVLIQDLHSNVGVQKKILGMLQYFQEKAIGKGKSMVLGMEGAWGPLNVDRFRNVEAKRRTAASDLLLNRAEISGMEYFAVENPEPVNFHGIENPKDYLVHLGLYQKSLLTRLHLAKKIDTLRKATQSNKKEAPRSLRKLWSTEEDFRAGKIGLDQLSKIVGQPLNNYGQAEKALESHKLSIAERQDPDQAFYLRNVIKSDQNLDLLSRLLRQNLTFEEVQMAGNRIPELLMTVRALLPKEDMKQWDEAVRSAIDHYAVALLRDQPMSARAMELVKKYPGQSVVLVAGGFHAAGISDALKQQRISYVVIAPNVESHTSKDEKVYLYRMMGVHYRAEDIAEGVKTRPTSHTVNPVGSVVGSVLPAVTGAPSTELVRGAGEVAEGAFGPEGQAPAPGPEQVAKAKEVKKELDPAAGGNPGPKSTDIQPAGSTESKGPIRKLLGFIVAAGAALGLMTGGATNAAAATLDTLPVAGQVSTHGVMQAVNLAGSTEAQNTLQNFIGLGDVSAALGAVAVGVFVAAVASKKVRTFLRQA